MNLLKKSTKDKKCSNCGLPKDKFFMDSNICTRCVDVAVRPSVANESSVSVVPNIISRPHVPDNEISNISAAYARLKEKDKPKSPQIINEPVRSVKEEKIMSTPAKYGESPEIRVKNGQRLKQMRIKLGLSAAKAAELLKLKNAPAINNAEVGCSTLIFNERMAMFQQIERDMVQQKEALPGGLNPKRGRPAGVAASPVKTLPLPRTTKTPIASLQKKEEPAAVPSKPRTNAPTIADSQNKKTMLLEQAVKRLARIENKSETDVWLELISGQDVA